MGIEIRAAKCDDAPAMSRLMVDTWLEAHRGQMPDHLWEARRSEWTYEVSERGWRRMLAGIAGGSNSNDRVFVATENGTVVGLAACTAKPDLRTVSVGSLYVLVTHQRMHIGRDLLDRVLAEYAELEAKAVHIGVLAANVPARRFYEAMGGQLGEKRDFDEEGEMLPEVVYVWDIRR